MLFPTKLLKSLLVLSSSSEAIPLPSSSTCDCDLVTCAKPPPSLTLDAHPSRPVRRKLLLDDADRPTPFPLTYKGGGVVSSFSAKTASASAAHRNLEEEEGFILDCSGRDPVPER